MIKNNKKPLISTADRQSYNDAEGWDVCGHIDLLKRIINIVLIADVDGSQFFLKDGVLVENTPESKLNILGLKSMVTNHVSPISNAPDDDERDYDALLLGWLNSKPEHRQRFSDLIATRLQKHLNGLHPLLAQAE